MSAEFLPDPTPTPAYGGSALHPVPEARRLFLFRRPRQLEPHPLHPEIMRWNPSAERAAAVVRGFLRTAGAYSGDFPEVHILDTHPDASAMAEEFEANGITSEDGVAVVGGDGTHSDANEAARLAGFKGSMLAIAAGNACDLTHMLLRHPHIKDPARAVMESRQAKLYPLRVAIGSLVLNSEAYFSAGEATYQVGREVADPVWRARTENMHSVERFRQETLMTKRKLPDARRQPLWLEDNRGRRLISDVIFPNGWRMAKQIRFSGVKLLEPGYGRLELPKATVASVLTTFGKAGIGAFERCEADKTYECTVSSIDGSPVHAQRDGEIFEFPSGSTLTVGVQEDYTNQATTRRTA
ncbi:MAG TPA: hypothetical protein VFH39_04900 [Candidatus Saccharimonadales bacterium]|nr:hypothetical protein [Candidatus Saccharimonadales bacterium]